MTSVARMMAVFMYKAADVRGLSCRQCNVQTQLGAS